MQAAVACLKRTTFPKGCSVKPNQNDPEFQAREIRAGFPAMALDEVLLLFSASKRGGCRYVVSIEAERDGVHHTIRWTPRRRSLWLRKTLARRVRFGAAVNAMPEHPSND